jgi:hypothetical protein
LRGSVRSIRLRLCSAAPLMTMLSEGTGNYIAPLRPVILPRPARRQARRVVYSPGHEENHPKEDAREGGAAQ